MSSRPLLAPYQIVGGTEPGSVSGSMAASITSPVTIISNTSMISYDISWTGTTPIGVMVAQSSNTYKLNADGTVANAGDWSDLPLSSTPTVSGNTGNGVIEIDASAMYAVRIRYVRTSGTGTMNITVAGKVS